MVLREFVFILLASLPALAQDVLTPVSVCEVARNISAWEGKPVALAGRYSKRSDGRWLAQEHCGGLASLSIKLVQDDQRAPRIADTTAMDPQVVEKKLNEIRTTTSLAHIRFGSPDYDRWAIVFGVIERSSSTLRLIFRGEGVVFFYPEP